MLVNKTKNDVNRNLRKSMNVIKIITLLQSLFIKECIIKQSLLILIYFIRFYRISLMAHFGRSILD